MVKKEWGTYSECQKNKNKWNFSCGKELVFFFWDYISQNLIKETLTIWVGEQKNQFVFMLTMKI